MKKLTKSILTVLITYGSICIISTVSIRILMTTHADSIFTLLTAVIICICLSLAGICLRKQPANVWLPFALTICTAWLIAIILGNAFESLIGTSSHFTIIINQVSLILGYPGFAFGMCMGERAIKSTEFITFAFYILCGVVPPAVTVIAAKIKK